MILLLLLSAILVPYESGTVAMDFLGEVGIPSAAVSMILVTSLLYFLSQKMVGISWKFDIFTFVGGGGECPTISQSGILLKL